MKPIAFALIALIAVGTTTAALAAGPTYYVSPSGNDAWSGKLADPNPAKSDGPFATLERARDAARKQSAIVQLRGGIHVLTKTLKLGADDSDLTICAYADEKPLLVGGRTIGGFTTYKGQILKTDTFAQGFKGSYFRQLFFNGKRQDLARYPNFDPANPYGGGWTYVDGKMIPMYQEVPGEDRRTLHFKAADARKWARPDEVEVFVFPRYNWWNSIVRIKSIDAANHVATLVGDAAYAIRPGDRYYFRNALEELDAPGEWYLDKQDGTLYFWPPAPLSGAAVYAPTVQNVIEATGASKLTIRGLTIECAENAAVLLKDCTDCLVAGNTIRNVGSICSGGSSAVSISGGKTCTVAGNDIYQVGSNAISLSGGDIQTLTPASHVADNNYVHHFGLVYKQGVGVNVNGVGSRVSRNLMHDGPRFGIGFGGNNHVIELNHIRHVNLETADTGAVYCNGRDWLTSRGTVLRYNYFHDILGYGRGSNGTGEWESPHFAWGIYLDDNSGGVDVIGNIVARCPRGLIHLHNGRDNVIENNVLVDAGLQQVEYGGWTPKHRYWTTHLPSMIEHWDKVKDEPAWKKLRGMDIDPRNAPLPDGKIMTGNSFNRNIVYYRDPKTKLFKFRDVPLDHYESDYNLFWHGGLPLLVDLTNSGQKPPQVPEGQQWDAWKKLGFEKHSVVADPLFVNAAKDDYRLRPESPALKVGFKPIPVEQIGPYKDELRASWPIVEAEGAREKPLVAGKPK